MIGSARQQDSGCFVCCLPLLVLVVLLVAGLGLGAAWALGR
jgi:hypothetical protein